MTRTSRPTEFPIVSHEQWVAAGSRVRLNDGEVFYVKRGTGYPLVLAHQFGHTSWWYSRVVPALAEHFTVYAFDWPGCGQSDPRPLPYDIPDFATALSALLDALEIERAHLVGIGGGAMTCLELAATRPQYVERLVLEVLPVWTRAEAKQVWRDVMQSWFDQNLVPRPFVEWADVDRMFQGLDAETRLLALERKAGDFAARGREWASMLTVGQLRYDARPRLPLVQAPTLLLNGEHANDHLRRHEREVRAAIPDARLEVVPNTHVTAAFDQPQLYVDLLLSFLRPT